MSEVLDPVECAKVIGGGPHHWAWFAGGRGCSFCSAWVSYPRREQTDDPHPTQFPAYSRDTPGYTYREAVAHEQEQADLDIEVMAVLLPVMAPTASWVEAQEVATRLIEIVQARAPR